MVQICLADKCNSSFQLTLFVIKESNLGRVSKHCRHLLLAFKGTIPAIKLVIAGKYHFAPAVKYFQANGFNALLCKQQIALGGGAFLIY